MCRGVRQPPDLAKEAEATLVAWGLLLLFAVVLGLVLKALK